MSDGEHASMWLKHARRDVGDNKCCVVMRRATLDSKMVGRGKALLATTEDELDRVLKAAQEFAEWLRLLKYSLIQR